MATSPSSTYLADNHLFSSPWPPLSSSPSMTAHRFMLRSASAYRFKSFFHYGLSSFYSDLLPTLSVHASSALQAP
ncbi:uncharacterized protein LOC129310417 isoform X4 [Prosopis cineraria]|uniref:uncharacterized protein LOC129310417 isoform X4 n=1 Tax=Prosopis cineraria TaxID=364024 RepID=UPI00240F99FF|nr:uncharacterized protein LOC129310417 isoform X4 [Prosopis cineraria]